MKSTEVASLMEHHEKSPKDKIRDQGKKRARQKARKTQAAHFGTTLGVWGGGWWLGVVWGGGLVGWVLRTRQKKLDLLNVSEFRGRKVTRGKA